MQEGLKAEADPARRQGGGQGAAEERQRVGGLGVAGAGGRPHGCVRVPSALSRANMRPGAPSHSLYVCACLHTYICTRPPMSRPVVGAQPPTCACPSPHSNTQMRPPPHASRAHAAMRPRSPCFTSPSPPPPPRPHGHRICILAGDISPIDVLTHIPVVCEDHAISYIYVPSKEVRARLPRGAMRGRGRGA